jgi:hypothetical protein
VFTEVAQRFEEARQVVHRQALRFGCPPDGPLAGARLAPSGDWMQGPFSDAVRATVWSMLGLPQPLSGEWACLARALNRAAGEGRGGGEDASGGADIRRHDPEACLRPYRPWEPASWRLDPGWARSHGRGSGHLFLTPDLARRLADHLRDGSEELEFERRRFVQAMEPFGILVRMP